MIRLTHLFRYLESMHKMNNSSYKMNGSSYKMNSSSYKMNGDIGAKKYDNFPLFSQFMYFQKFSRVMF